MNRTRRWKPYRPFDLHSNRRPTQVPVAKTVHTKYLLRHTILYKNLKVEISVDFHLSRVRNISLMINWTCNLSVLNKDGLLLDYSFCRPGSRLRPFTNTEKVPDRSRTAARRETIARKRLRYTRTPTPLRSAPRRAPLLPDRSGEAKTNLPPKPRSK